MRISDWSSDVCSSDLPRSKCGFGRIGWFYYETTLISLPKRTAASCSPIDASFTKAGWAAGYWARGCFLTLSPPSTPPVPLWIALAVEQAGQPGTGASRGVVRPQQLRAESVARTQRIDGVCMGMEIGRAHV